MLALLEHGDARRRAGVGLDEFLERFLRNKSVRSGEAVHAPTWRRSDMLLTVWHSTVYRYETEVARSTQLHPPEPERPAARQTHRRLEVDLPAPAVTMTDAFDNLTHVLTMTLPHQDIQLLARGRVEVDDEDDGEPAGRINPRVFLRARAHPRDDAIARSCAAARDGEVAPMMG
jgi:hypothetical protein